MTKEQLTRLMAIVRSSVNGREWVSVPCEEAKRVSQGRRIMGYDRSQHQMVVLGYYSPIADGTKVAIGSGTIFVATTTYLDMVGVRSRLADVDMCF